MMKYHGEDPGSLFHFFQLFILFIHLLIYFAVKTWA